jgi:hypothetical protein
MSEKLETVATFNDLTQAQGARAVLESAGIESMLQDESTGSIDWGLMPAMGGLRLQVAVGDAAGAREALGSFESAAPESDDPEEAEHLEASRRRKRLVGLVSFFILFLPMLIGFIVAWFF